MFRLYFGDVSVDAHVFCRDWNKPRLYL